MHFHRAILFSISCLLAIINARAACVPAPSNLVAWYKGETATSDEVTQGRGTIRGTPTFVNGVSGQGFHFNGGKDAIVLNDNTPFRLQEFTIEAWIRRSRTDIVSDSPGGCAIFSSGAGGYSLAMTHEGSPAVSYVGVSRIDGPRVITDTNWHHVATTRSNKVVRIFVDGKLVQEGVQDVTYSFDTPFAIGSMGSDIGGTFYSFIGDIDEVSVYSGALAESDILKIYNAGSEGKCPIRTNCESPDGLMAYWSANNTTSEHLASLPGEIVGGTQFVEGVSGKAFRFDGQSDGVVIPNSERLQLQNFSIAMWMKRGDLVRTSYDFDGGALFAGGLGSYALAIQNNGTLCISKVGVTRSCSGPAVTDLNWHHVAMSKVNNQVTFFMDGVKRSTTTFDQTFEFSTPFGIGSVGNLVQGLWDSFWGDIDDVAVYSRAVTESEMLALAESRQPPVCLQDISIQFTSAPKLVKVNEDTLFKVRVANKGGQAATAVRIQWPLKAGQSLARTSLPPGSCAIQDSVLRCDLGLLPGSSSLDLEFVYRFSETSPIEHEITVSRGEPDVSLENNIARARTTVIGSCLPPLPGLIGLWPGEGNAWDVIGGFNGDFSSPSYSPGVDAGQAFQFDGSNTLSMGNSPKLRPPQFTWSLWVKPTSFNANSEILIAQESDNSAQVHSKLGIKGLPGGQIPAGQLLFRVGVPDWPDESGTFAVGGQSIPLGTWTHVALTYHTNGTAIAFVNGVATRTIQVAAQSAPNGGPLFIGGTRPNSIHGAAVNHFDGSIDELGLYDHPLTADEVRLLYEAGTRVLCHRDLAVVWTETPKTLLGGKADSLGLVVRNGGSEEMKRAKLKISGTPGLVVTSAKMGADSCTVNNGLAECSIESIPAWSEIPVRVLVQALDASGPQNLTATVTSESPEDSQFNNSATTTIEVLGKCQPITDLVAWWPFENDFLERAQALTDALPPQGEFVPGRVGNALRLTGDRAAFNTRLPGLPKDTLSVEGWIQRSDLNRASLSASSGALIGSDNGAWNFSLSKDGSLSFGRTDHSHVDTQPVINDLLWHHVAVTLQNGSVTFFVDGVSIYSAAYEFTFEYPNPFAVGAVFTAGIGPRYTLLASLDELSVYAVGLTPETVRNLYNAGSSGRCFEDLALRIEPPPASIEGGETLPLRWIAENRGTTPATNVRFRFSVPSGYSVEYVLNPGGGCSLGNGFVTCELGTLQPGLALLVELGLRTSTAGTRLVLEPRIESDLLDAVPNNDRPRAEVEVFGDCLQAPAGLLAWWRGEGDLNEFTGANAPTPFVQTPTFTAGRIGQALNFDGTQTLAVARSNNLANPSITVSAWVRPTRLNGNVEILAVDELPSNALGPSFALGIRGPRVPGGQIPIGNLCFKIAGLTGLPNDYSRWVDAGAQVPQNQWSLVTLTVDSKLHSIATYVNGVETRRLEFLTGEIKNNGGGFYIGSHAIEAVNASSGLASDRFDGAIDELMVFGRALSAAEIQSIYKFGAAGVCPNDLELSLSFPSGSSVPLDQAFNIALSVANHGGSAHSKVTVTNSLPPNIFFVSATASAPGVSTRMEPNQLITEFGTLAGNSTASVVYRLIASEGTGAEWKSVLTSVGPDLNASNNQFSQTLASLPVRLELIGNAPTNSPNEDAGMLEFEVRLNVPTANPITVDYATESGSAIEGLDFIRTTGVLSIPPGQSRGIIRIPIINDRITEDVEFFSVILSNANGAGIQTANAKGYIIGTSTLPSLSVRDVLLTEGSGTPNFANFNVQLSAPSLNPVTVDYTTVNGTARAGLDFNAEEASVSFAPGELSKTIAVRITPDTSNEPNEQFLLFLKGAVGATIADGIGVATLMNDDGPSGQLAGFRCEILTAPIQTDSPTQVRVTALDASGNPLGNYSGAVSLGAYLGAGSPARVVLTEIFSDLTSNILELQNVSATQVDLSGWSITVFDADRWPAPQTTLFLPAGTLLAPGELFTIADGTVPMGGTSKQFTLGTKVKWITTTLTEDRRKLGVVLQDANGRVEDTFFADGANPAELGVPVRITSENWSGPPLTRPISSETSYSRFGNSNQHGSSAWVWMPPSIGVKNASLFVPFIESVPLSVAPAFVTEFINGVFTGPIQVTPPTTGFHLFVDDGNGQTGISGPVTVPFANDVSVEMIAPSSVVTGNKVPFLLRVHNPGPLAVSGLTASIQIQGAVSDNASFFGSNTHGGIPSIDGSSGNWIVTAPLNQIAPEATAEIRFNLNADSIPGIPGIAWITSAASVSISATDLNPFNQTAAAITEVAQSPAVIPGSEIAWWSASGGGRDLAGAHHGTLSPGATIRTGRVGTSFHFEGPDAAFIVPEAADLNVIPGKTVSFEFWLRTASPDPRENIEVFSKRHPISGTGYALTLDSGVPVFTLYNGVSGSEPIRARGPIWLPVRDGAWHHIAVVLIREGTTPSLKVFVDRLNTSTSPSQPRVDFSNSAALRFGNQDPKQAATAFVGDLDEITLWAGDITSALPTIFASGGNGRLIASLVALVGSPLSTAESASDLSLYPGVERQPYQVHFAVKNSGPHTAYTARFRVRSSAPLPSAEWILGSAGTGQSLNPKLHEVRLAPIAEGGTVQVTLRFTAPPTDLILDTEFDSDIPNQLFTPTKTLHLSFAADTDGDGMSDEWELAHGLDPANPADAASDADGDGLPNVSEFRLGTSPRDATSGLQITMTPSSDGTIDIQWVAQPNRLYQVVRKAALDDANWEVLAEHIGSEVQQLRAHDAHPLSESALYAIRVMP